MRCREPGEYADGLSIKLEFSRKLSSESDSKTKDLKKSVEK